MCSKKPPTQTKNLVGSSLKTIGNIAHIASSRTHWIRQVVVVNRARVIEPQSSIDVVGCILIPNLYQILLKMVCTSHNHGGNLILSQVMLTRECRALFSLHQASSSLNIVVCGSSNTDVTGAFLHDDAENDALFDADFGGFKDGVPDAADVFTGITSLEHFGLVGVEDFFEGFPGVHSWEAGGGTLVRCETHFECM